MGSTSLDIVQVPRINDQDVIDAQGVTVEIHTDAVAVSQADQDFQERMPVQFVEEVGIHGMRYIELGTL